jgi:deoxyribose-phosphate aldolase
MANDIQTLLLTKNDLADTDLRAFIETLDDKAIKELFVLPTSIARTKTLLENAGKHVLVGSFVDYPLAAGTTAKVAFETGELFRLGADILQISMSVAKIHAREWERLTKAEEAVRPLMIGHGTIRFAVETEFLKEMDKIMLARKIVELGITHVALDCPDVQTAIHDASVFSLDSDGDLFVQVNVKSSEAIDAKAILDNGANQIGQFVV